MPHPFFELPSPVILGHRGAAGSAPENTITGFERGLALGADVLESDLQLTRDGVPVLIHDDEIDRVSNGKGRVADFALAELQRWDAGYRYSPDAGHSFPYRGTGLRIPSLEEVFDALPDARFNLELKADDPALVEAVVRLVRSSRREHRTLLTAGADPIMDRLRAELRRAGSSPALGASLAGILAVIQSAAAGRAPDTDAMALQIPAEFGGQPLVTRELIEHAHAHGIQIHVWTINEPAEMRRLLERGVDGIVTDHPERLAALVGPRDRT